MEDITIPNVLETELSPQRVFTSDDVPTVDIRRRVVDGGYAIEYSIESQLLLNRDLLDNRLRSAIGEPGSGWRETRNGLRSIGLQNQRIVQLGRSARLGAHLGEIKQASLQLSDMLKKSSDQDVKTGVVPAYTYGQSTEETYEQLLSSDTRDLLDQLLKLGYDKKLADEYAQYSSVHVPQDPFKLDEFHGLFEDMNGFDRTILNHEVLDAADASTLLELLASQQKKWFKGFRRYGEWDEQTQEIHGGSLEDDMYIRNEDVPGGMIPRHTDISVGLVDPDDERAVAALRHQVRFYSDRYAIFARPLFVWREYGNQASLQFPGRPLDGPNFQTMRRPVTRANSMAGAAMAAALFGNKAEIPYGKELDRLIRKSGVDINLHARAGLWPIVARYQQDALLSMPIFQEAKDRLDSKV